MVDKPSNETPNVEIPKVPAAAPKTARPAEPAAAKPAAAQPAAKPAPRPLPGRPGAKKTGIGNKLGWIIAGGLVVVVIAVVLFFVLLPQPSDPTTATTAPGVLDLKTPRNPADVIGALPTGAGNAADDYVAAMKICKENDPMIRNFAASESVRGLMEGTVAPPAPLLAALKKVDECLAPGTAKAGMQYYFAYTPKKSFDSEFGADFAAQNEINGQFAPLSEALQLLALYYQGKKEFAEEEKVLKHEFILGLHMAAEQARVRPMEGGLGLQQDAAEKLAALYTQWGGDNAKKAEGPKRYLDEIREVNSVNRAKERIVWELKLEPGDIFNIIENDQNRAWRVEAILRCGMIKLNGSRGDKRYAMKMIDQFEAGPDPVEAEAAKAAKAFTDEDLYNAGR